MNYPHPDNELRTTSGAATGETYPREVDAPGLLGSAAPVDHHRLSEQYIREALSYRFMTAASSPAPTEAQRALVAENQRLIILAAAQVVRGSVEGREQALALTKLEEALMWANKAVFRG
jgi:hypothetical protein